MAQACIFIVSRLFKSSQDHQNARRSSVSKLYDVGAYARSMGLMLSLIIPK